VVVDPPGPALTRPVVLVGLSGSGKSTVAPLLARRLGVCVVDLDGRIEVETGRRVAEIFADSGEPGFRRAELDALRSVLAEVPSVVAAGGGVVCTPAARALLARDAVVIWLDAPDEVLLGRLDDPRAPRPLLRDDPTTTLRRLRREREAWYAEVADVRVSAGHLDPLQVAEAVLAELSTIGAVP
jgi:shikimate kinase